MVLAYSIMCDNVIALIVRRCAFMCKFVLYFILIQVLDRYIEYCEWCQSDDGPRYTVKGDKEITVTTAVLLNAMRNIMHGLPNVQRFRTALNDVYMDKLRGLNGDPNPSCREVVRKLFACISGLLAVWTGSMCFV